MKEKIKNILSKNLWYHGTTKSSLNNILNNGIIVDYNKYRELDFGYGFYLMPKKKEACKYINRLLEVKKQLIIPNNKNINKNNDALIPVVIEFEFQPLEFFQSNIYKSKIFEHYDDEFAKFIFYNRLNYKNEEKLHDYDIIYGVMSDSNPVMVIEQYRNGEIKEDEAIEYLKKSTSVKQLSIHNKNICENLSIKNYYVVDNKGVEI